MSSFFYFYLIFILLFKGIKTLVEPLLDKIPYYNKFESV